MPTYNPKDIVVTVNGIPVTGFADGTDVILVEYDTDFVSDAVGVTGESAFIENNDRRANVTLKLMATSSFNDVLSALSAGNVEFAMSLTDARGTTIGASPACRVKKLPTVQFGNEIGTREWEIRALDMVLNVGGNIS
jgi:hypothetical protein